MLWLFPKASFKSDLFSIAFQKTHSIFSVLECPIFIVLDRCTWKS